MKLSEFKRMTKAEMIAYVSLIDKKFDCILFDPEDPVCPFCNPRRMVGRCTTCAEAEK